MKIQTGLLLIAVVVCGCRTTVNLTVTNPTTVPQQVTVTVKTPSGDQESQIEMGTIGTNGQQNTTFSVKHGGQFALDSSIPGSASAPEQSKTITRSDPDPDHVTIALNPPGNVLNSADAAAQIENALNSLGPNIGFNPIPVQNALDTVFGALVVVPNQSATNYSGQTFLFQLLPGQFSPKTSLSDFRYPDDNVGRTVEIDGSSSMSVGASVPMYGSLNLDSSSSSVYKVNYSLSNYGMVEKADPTNWTYSVALQNLSPADKAQLYNVLRANPGSELLYINKMYVVEQATFGISQATKLTSDAKLDATSVLTASGAYSFSNTGEQNTTFNGLVVNIGGIQISLDVATISPTNTVEVQPVENTGASIAEAVRSGQAKLLPSKITIPTANMLRNFQNMQRANP